MRLVFRDPARTTPQRNGLVISPADGVVNMITELCRRRNWDWTGNASARLGFHECIQCACEPYARERRGPQISIPHWPVSERRFDKASEANERQSLLIETEDGQTLVVVQIAGLVARRVLCFVHEDQEVTAGERFGLIRFGSRCDVYLLAGANAG